MDSGALNLCIFGYLEAAMHHAEIPYETRESLWNGMRYALDSYTADEAEQIYREGISVFESDVCRDDFER